MLPDQAWRTVHPPKRGHYGRRPLVHLGFNKSWTRNDLNLRVVDRVLEILGRPDVDAANVRVLVTGMSLLCSL